MGKLLVLEEEDSSMMTIQTSAAQLPGTSRSMVTIVVLKALLRLSIWLKPGFRRAEEGCLMKRL